MTNSTYQERLSEILKNIDTLKTHAFPDGNPFQHGGISLKEAQEAITSLMLDVIGEDEGLTLIYRTMKPHKNERNRKAKVRDAFRNELRKTLKGDTK